MLSDREKLVLHLVAMMTIARINDIPHRDKLIHKMIEEVIHNRCRSLAPEDIEDLLKEINEEMLVGKIMFEHLMGDTIWSMTGERPNKNTNWRDMR